MGYERTRGPEAAREAGQGAVETKIGAATLVQALEGNLSAPSTKVGASSRTSQLGEAGGDIHGVAAMGTAGSGGALPHGDAIQRAFGRHDVGGIQAHVGGDAATASRALGAEAYATGSHVAFGATPSLHTAAHEAAHVVQQRGGVQLKGGVGAAGDAHEQHADAVADAVVHGRSAEALLDPYANGGGGGSGAAVQRKPGDPPTPAPDAGVAPDAAPAVDPKLIIQKLGQIPAMGFDVTKPSFDIDAVAAWIELYLRTVNEAKLAAGAAAPPELTQAVDHCVTTHAPALQKAAEQIRTATVQMTNDSSVSRSTPGVAAFPTQAQVAAFARDAAKLSQLTRDPTLAIGDAAKATLQAAAATAQDAALAMLQSLSVVSARDRWKLGNKVETPAPANVGKGPRNALDDVYKDANSDLGDRAEIDPTTGRAYDWCGIFVAASYFKGAGLAKQLHAGLNHVLNVEDLFQYQQNINPARSPMSIWAEDQWWNLRDYHKARGSLRQWTPRATIKAALAAGGSGDIRPGDTCLIAHDGGNTPAHIVMVESYDPATKLLVSIEGNTFGIHVDKTDGSKAEHVDDDHLKDSAQGSGTSTGLHVRDMRKLAPGPGTYVVVNTSAFVREDDDVAKLKKQDGKKVVIPAGTEVDVTEIKDVGGSKYARITDWGWTSFVNLDSTGTPPKDGYKAKSGATVFAVGRPSVVDFEDGHEYSINQVPADLKTTSPAEMHELAKHKDKKAAAIKKLGLK